MTLNVSEEEHWMFNQSDLGKYDIPAFLDTITEFTGKPKVTYIGYSLGTN